MTNFHKLQQSPRRCFSTHTNTTNESISNALNNHESFQSIYGFREGLPRFPDPTTPTGILRGLDYFGTLVFAASGGLTAATCGCDLLGTLAVGTITAVGGGTIRDTIVLNKQPFWFEGNDGCFYCSPFFHLLTPPPTF